MRKLFGGILIVCGILIAGLSGLCSLLMLGGGLFGGGGQVPDAAAMVLFIGGIPFVIGIGMFLAGRALTKSEGAPPPITPHPTHYDPQARPAHPLDQPDDGQEPPSSA